MASLYVNSFRPLAINPAGREASERRGLPPFIDGSIRREPDFEHQLPVITCLCRADKFTPRLRVGDRVVYITVHAKYGLAEKHHRVVAVLEVVERFESHREAAAWYRAGGHPLPNNLMVPGNRANPLSKSHAGRKSRGRASCGGCPPKPDCGGCGKRSHAEWDREYRERAAAYPRVVRCVHLVPPFLDWDAPVITKTQLAKVFGKDPNTRNPGRQDIRLLPKLLREAGIPVPPSCR